MKEFDEIDDLFSSAFAGAESTPSPKVKESIDNSLFPGAKGSYLWVYSVLIFALFCGGIVAYQSAYSINSNVKVKTLLEIENSEKQVENAFNSSSTSSYDDYELTSKKLKNTSQPKINEEVLNVLEANSSGENPNITAEFRVLDSDQNIIDSKSGSNYNDANFIQYKATSTQKLADNMNPSKFNLEVKNMDSKTKSGYKSKSVNDGIVGVSYVFDSQGLNAELKESSIKLNDSEELINYVSELKTYSANPFIIYPIKEIDTTAYTLPAINLPIFKMNPWYIIFYGGGQGAFNSHASTDANSYDVSDIIGADVSLEVTYALGSKFAIGTGVSYSERKTTLRRNITVTDSVSLGGQWVVNNPSQPDSLQDSTFVEMFDVVQSTLELSSLTKQNSFGIPVYVSYALPIAQRFKFRVGVGAIFSYESFKVIKDDSGLPVSNFSVFGVNAMLRPEFTYGLGKTEIGLYGKVNYDLKQSLSWDVISRKRYGIGAGIVFRYKF
ncbi:MAG: outer membrane beta-barrel protein [Crocinitomicaceae bacterium]|nr:outer membrane beta-barrel protein [Crocinitomicaceae bacterium]